MMESSRREKDKKKYNKVEDVRNLFRLKKKQITLQLKI